VPEIPQEITEKYGISDANKDRIEGITILGDQLVFWEEGQRELRPEDLAEQVRTTRGNDWFRYSDNQRIQYVAYDNLQFLEKLAGLRSLYIVRAGISRMPGLPALEKVWISDASVDDLSWLRGSAVRSVTVRDSGTPDLTPLDSCENLEEADLDVLKKISTVRSLENLSGTQKKYIASAAIAGDNVFDPRDYEIEAYSMKTNRKTNWMAIAKPRTGLGSTICTQGDLKDLTLLEGADRLTELIVAAQPLTTLNGLAELKKLDSLQLITCLQLRSLEGLSGTGIHCLDLRNCTSLGSLNGADGMTALTTLRLTGLEKLASLNALRKCDFTYVNTQTDGFRLYITDTKIADYSPLSGIECFREMEIPGTVNAEWIKAMKYSRVISLKAESIQNQSVFESLTKGHPEMESLEITSAGNRLKDLKPLAEMPNLKTVVLLGTSNEDALRKTLQDVEHSFKLSIKK
jgi:hypothetical protein